MGLPIGLLGSGSSFEEIAALAVLAEDLGFDGFFLPEHHQEPFWPSAPLITLAGLAARTQRIRLGTAVTVMGLHNPVRLAEETATLDRSSGGRAIVGLGLGYIERDFAALGAPRSARVSLLEEGVEVLRRAWTQRPFSFQGRRFRFEGVSIYPEPVQRPHPPLWLAAWSRDGVRRAAGIADGWLTDPIHGLDAIALLAQEYRDAAREAGRQPCVVLMRQFAVAEDAARAAALYGEMAANVWRYYWRNGSFNLLLEPAWRRVKSPEAIDASTVLPRRVPFGGPQECLEGFRQWIDTLRPDYVIAVPTPSTLGQAALEAQVRLFGEAVLPRLAEP